MIIHLIIAQRAHSDVIGKNLQRWKDEFNEYLEFISDPNQTDPSEEDPILKRKLEENRKEGEKKMTEVFQR